MDEGQDQEPQVPPGQRHIIRRPRLERLLDESKARVIMLVAPAGYGKTTLARQWLESGGRRAAWHRVTTASRDVAALAQGVVFAAAQVMPEDSARMSEGLRGVAATRPSGESFGTLLVEELRSWPNDAWLALDDYHLGMESESAERLIELLWIETPIQLLLTSRRRPGWATARRILYGDAYELGPSALAMTHEEANEVLAGRQGAKLGGLLALADGWPAVIGLAARAKDFALPGDSATLAMHDFLAQELLDSLTEERRHQVAQLAIAPGAVAEVARHLYGEAAQSILMEGERVGVLMRDHVGGIEIHPLMQAFLEARFRADPRGLNERVAEVGRFLIDRGMFDDAWTLAERFEAPDLLMNLIEVGLTPALEEGRLATVGRWVERAREIGVEEPVVPLAEAHLALREGHFLRAKALALDASRKIEPTHVLASKIYYLVGQATYLSDARADTRPFFDRAQDLAQSATDLQHALWGRFLASVIADLEDADKVLNEFEAAEDGTPCSMLRVASARFSVAVLRGDIREQPRRLREAALLLDRCSDPMARSGFLVQCSYAHSLATEYREASRWADVTLAEAERSRLAFALPSAHLAAAGAAMGQRDFARAYRALEEAQRLLGLAPDAHAEMNSEAVASRLFLAEGRIEEALAAVSADYDRPTPPVLQAEYLACRALALACAGEGDTARQTATLAASLTASVEVTTLATCVHAVAALRESGPDFQALARTAFEAGRNCGALDAFVCAYRAYPRLAMEIAREPRLRAPLGALLRRCNDDQLATRLRLSEVPRSGVEASLSPREREVYALLVAGLSNRQIAERLFLSEVTVKVHVRHIFEKLGVRSRLEAAVLARED